MSYLTHAKRVYTSQTVVIPGTEEPRIAIALAEIAGFKGYSVDKRVSESRSMVEKDAGVNVEKTTVIYHAKTIASDPETFRAFEDPDIVVTGKGNDTYLIEYNERFGLDVRRGLEERLKKFIESHPVKSA